MDDDYKECHLLEIDTNYHKTLIYFELNSKKTTQISLDDSIIKQFILTNDKINQVYILYGNKTLLIILKSHEYNTKQLIDDLCASIRSEFDLEFTQKQINTNFYLCSEITDDKLQIVSSDKSKSLKLIESKTGLKLKKIKKNIYFVGFLFQFELFDQLINDYKNHLIEPMNDISDWKEQYNNCSNKFMFTINKCDVYIFKADLSELNTDILINFTNPNLHPGYTGDGISRRIREKAGKQMQDCLKKILQTKSNSAFEDSECCETKTSGKLKGKYVFHSVCPKWNNYIIERLSKPSDINIEQFENLIQNTISNLFQLSNEDKFSNCSTIGLPVSSIENGGCFDLPLELFAHYFYTKLSRQSLNYINSICITSVQEETVGKLIDLFKNYSETCSNTLWTVPESPFNQLVSALIPLEQLSINCVKTKETSTNESNSPSSSSSSSISPVRIQRQIQRRPVYENHYHPITDVKIYIRKLNESCAGYERYRTILITFEVSDGIQKETHPKPGCPYKGIIKRAYLPDVKEHMELLAFYEKALKKGILFKLEWSKKYNDYAVQLNNDVMLKTSLNGGGKFGYPDFNYIDDLLIKARSFK
ncbi:unnamed protein product [Brachionus calyciflorus]|uniref:E3 ubiquitin-protein ligase n=1 Tax=Brachionus calyciflorus TaxID=104777 RepID=A0A814CJ76_9BILA|nr:unnamed protein product [Brachionus calyciflorus]